MKTRQIRTRYAPSPTGFFHIGGARTALFCYLFAKKNQGSFIVRIEDTDIERNVEGGIDSQLNNLDWMKITPDESPKKVPENNVYGPYVQTQKLRRYKELAENLLLSKKAYYCFCTKEELELSRENALENHTTPKYAGICLKLTNEEIQEKLKQNIPHVIRLKIEGDDNVEWDDLIRGKMSVPKSALTDPVILKSNGYPMYNFAVVIDDFDMDITHVLRGEEHISNTPYQIEIKKALEFDSREVKFGHLSVIVDESGKKLSKRNSELKQFIDDYRKMGILPEAIDNFLLLLGWSPKDNKEIISLEEAAQMFEVERLSKAPAFFDFKKLLWISNQYFKLIDENKYTAFVQNFVTFHPNIFGDNYNKVLLLFKNQISYAEQINGLVKETFLTKKSDELNAEQQAIINMPSFKAVHETFKELVEYLPTNEIDFEQGTKIINDVKTRTGTSGKELFMPMRFIVTGTTHGPELNKIISINGKEKLIQLINETQKYLNSEKHIFSKIN